ncbi:hypothetical protein [Streptomyces sp. CC219B]|uniref:hypothetical protein n=1 Tax=Streptomyces sp. CC219B TaxID=3044574 RepID=UPI0024A981B2|nr:hypothetical protein [Streptomyces sp. CC219B]
MRQGYPPATAKAPSACSSTARLKWADGPCAPAPDALPLDDRSLAVFQYAERAHRPHRDAGFTPAM